MLAGYDHLVRAADRLRWDDAAIDLAPDAAAWPRLPAALRDPLARLIAGFVVAEHAVADHLAPFEAAAEHPELAACFAVQADDEARHARFFARVAREVCRFPDTACTELPGAGISAHAVALAGGGVVGLFGDELPARARALAAGDADLASAVSLYHLVLEGVAFNAGQHALLHLLEAAPQLTGVREGVARVQSDERWHVGLGVRALQDLGAPAPGDLDALAQRAAACWAAPVDAEAALAVHHRRMQLVRPRASAR